ncbi:MAG: entericidin A/B family lipoprotein [Panacagrimonas sp.]
MNKLITGLTAALALFATVSLSGCNTLEGAGKDVERAGEKVQSANCTKEDSATDPNCKK